MYTITKVKQGRRIVCYDAVIDHRVIASGSTPIEVKQAAENAISRQLQYASKRHYIITDNGATFVLRYNFGWMYDIVTPTSTSTTILGDVTERQAYTDMYNHAQQYGNITSRVDTSLIA
jgi:hypothetical protein